MAQAECPAGRKAGGDRHVISPISPPLFDSGRRLLKVAPASTPF